MRSVLKKTFCVLDIPVFWTFKWKLFVSGCAEARTGVVLSSDEKMDRMEEWRYNQDGRVVRFTIG